MLPEVVLNMVLLRFGVSGYGRKFYLSVLLVT